MEIQLTHYTCRNSIGFSTIEILIAFSVGIIFLTAAMMVSFSDPTLARQISLDSGQATALDATLDNTALASSTNKMGSATAALMKNWSAVLVGDHRGNYENILEVSDSSACIKVITNSTIWDNTIGGRSRNITFGTALSDMSAAIGLGGDCDPVPSAETWKKPRIFSSHNFNPGRPQSIDVLQRIVYITDDKGNLQIYDSRNDVLGSNSGFSITPFTDSFAKVLNDIDVFKMGNRRYALIVRHDTTNQLQVVDVTTPGTYVASQLKALAGTVPPTGSFPQGWKVFYYDNRAYVTTRETAGFEFHIFNVSSPLSPVEIGPGLEINGTINDLQITGIEVNGTPYKIAFLATERSANEIMVLNVTNAASPSVLTSVDLPTNNDAYSLQLLGNRLYVGRQRTSSGPELFVYNVTYGTSAGAPTVALAPIGSGAEINTDVTYLKIAGKLAFLGNSSPNEFRVWDVSHPASGFTRIDTSPLNVSNKVFGVDHEAPYIYVVSQANDSLQILYSAP